MPEADLALLTDAARAAGALAATWWQKGARAWTKPDNSPVTEADLAVDALLKERLTAARPGYGWLSEETPDDAARLAHELVFVVDPIDGTSSFARGGRDWAVALAVVENGQPRAAVIFLPLKEVLYAAARGHGATRNGAPIRASDRTGLDGALVLSTRASLDPARWRGAPPALDRQNRGSLSYRLALVAEGRFDATFSARETWEWDLAPGTLIATEAGALVTDARGAALRFNAPDPRANGLIAAPPVVHAALAARLA